MNRTIPELTTDTDSTGKIPKKPGPIKGFFEFLSKHSIVSLALGVIIAQTTKDVVDSLVTGIITPFIQLLLPNFQLQNLILSVGNAQFQIGTFLDTLIQMLITLLLLYIVVGVLLKKEDWLSKK